MTQAFLPLHNIGPNNGLTDPRHTPIFSVLIGLTSAGCQIVASPLAGGIYNETKYGDVATDAAAAGKEGKACATSILGWVATGDASVQAAKSAGGITTVASVDHSAKNILGIFGEWCTIVRGN